MALIRKFLKSGAMTGGLVSQTERGTPQGGNLPPLLSDIYLTKFDRMLEERGHKFVRYADDCNIYVKSLRAAGRVMEGRIKYLEGKLRLKVNRKKSTAGSPAKLKFPGFSLYGINGKTGIRVHGKPLERFRKRLKAITGRKRGGKIGRIPRGLIRYINGRLAYYRIADIRSILQTNNEWLRRRIRQFYWKRRKKVRTRFENLIKLGVPGDKAWQRANTRKSYWRTAKSRILATTLNNRHLEPPGFPNLLKRYEELRERAMRLEMLRGTC